MFHLAGEVSLSKGEKSLSGEGKIELALDGTKLDCAMCFSMKPSSSSRGWRRRVSAAEVLATVPSGRKREEPPSPAAACWMSWLQGAEDVGKKALQIWEAEKKTAWGLAYSCRIRTAAVPVCSQESGAELGWPWTYAPGPNGDETPRERIGGRILRLKIRALRGRMRGRDSHARDGKHLQGCSLWARMKSQRGFYQISDSMSVWKEVCVLAVVPSRPCLCPVVNVENKKQRQMGWFVSH